MCGGGAADADADGICDNVDDCVGALDECGICNSPGAIYECGVHPAGDCDCDAELDALGVCSGDCEADADADGICDDVDDCVGALDACRLQRRRFTSVDVQTSQKVTATVTATSSTPWACVVVTAQRMRMATVCATMLKSADVQTPRLYNYDDSATQRRWFLRLLLLRR